MNHTHPPILPRLWATHLLRNPWAPGASGPNEESGGDLHRPPPRHRSGRPAWYVSSARLKVSNWDDHHSYIQLQSASRKATLDCYGSDEFIYISSDGAYVNLCHINFQCYGSYAWSIDMTMLVGNAYHIFMVVQLAWYDMAPLYEECWEWLLWSIVLEEWMSIEGSTVSWWCEANACIMRLGINNPITPHYSVGLATPSHGPEYRTLPKQPASTCTSFWMLGPE